MASIRKRAPWRVVIDGKDDTYGPFISNKQAEARKATLVAQGVEGADFEADRSPALSGASGDSLAPWRLELGPSAGHTTTQACILAESARG